MIDMSRVGSSRVSSVELSAEIDPVSSVAREALAPVEAARLNLKNYRWCHIALALIGSGLLLGGAYVTGASILIITLIALQRLKSSNIHLQSNANGMMHINVYLARLDQFMHVLKTEDGDILKRTKQILAAHRDLGNIDRSLFLFTAHLERLVSHYKDRYDLLNHYGPFDEITTKSEFRTLIKPLDEYLQDVTREAEKVRESLIEYQDKITPPPGIVPGFPESYAARKINVSI